MEKHKKHKTEVPTSIKELRAGLAILDTCARLHMMAAETSFADERTHAGKVCQPGYLPGVAEDVPSLPRSIWVPAGLGVERPFTMDGSRWGRLGACATPETTQGNMWLWGSYASVSSSLWCLGRFACMYKLGQP